MTQRKKLQTIALTALSIFALGSTVFGTFAWFQAAVHNDSYNVTGKSAGAYFAYGNGSDPNAANPRPYGIATPRQLYNLAWLQYMGQFNAGDKEDADPKKQGMQYYFELADSIPETGLDMTGYILPPIGTEDNPFVGNFNGNGKIIKNLTVSNDESVLFNPLNPHPDTSQVNYSAPEIVGMFGVVGNLDDAYSGTYSNSVNKVYNLGISDFTIETTTEKALVGILAGYVDADVDNVAVKDGAVNVNRASTAALTSGPTDKLSDYSIVGFCTDSHKTKVVESEGKVFGVSCLNNDFVVKDEGTETGLGGSINMLDLFKRIGKARGNTVTQSLIRQTTLYDNDENKTRLSATDQVYNSKNAWNNYGGAYLNNSTDKIGTYNSALYNNNEKFECLIGGVLETASFIDEYYHHEGYFITDGTNYLTYNNGLTNVTNSNSASIWVYESYSNDVYYIYTQVNDTKYYLYYNNGSLGVRANTKNSSGRFKVAKNTSVEPQTLKLFYNGNTDYQLLYIDGSWDLFIVTDKAITDGTNYMFFNGSIRNTTTPGAGYVWEYDDSGSNTYISCVYNGTTYYLRNNGGTLTTTTNTRNRTSWSVSLGANNSIDIYNGTYHLTYEGNWTLYNTAGTPYYLIHDDADHYMGTTSSYITTTVDRASAVKFGYSTSAHGYYNLSSTSYYVGYYSDSYGCQLYSDDVAYYRLVKSDNVNQLTDNLYGTGYLRTFQKKSDNLYSTTKYVRWDNKWTYGNNTNEAANITIEYIDPTSFTSTLKKSGTLDYSINNPDSTERDGPDYTLTNDSPKQMMKYSAENTTYIPLNVVADGEQTDLSKYQPKANNTGYLVAGSRSSILSSLGTTDDLSNASSTRVSKFDISNISASYNSDTKTLSNIYTLNENNQIQRIGNGYYNKYQEFDKAKEKLKTMLGKDSSYVYGLHYVEAEVGMDHKVVPSYALINGHEYYTADKYELPVNTINFNLAEKGFINFFAGMYYSANDAMFSLFQIRRNNDNTIAEIKEIDAVLSDGDEGHSYVYRFKDGQYSVPFTLAGNGDKLNFDGTPYDEATSLNGGTTAPTGYANNGVDKVAFNTSRITNYTSGGSRINDDFSWGTTPGASGVADKSVTDANGNSMTINKSIYYFEIPMNIGEFALGSTKYGYGGYLFYLDIGANARRLDRTTFIEKFSLTESISEYPNGVQFVDEFTINAGTFVIDASDSACLALLPSYNAKLEVTRTDDTISFKNYNSTYSQGEYKKNTITMQDGNSPPTPIPIVSKEKTTDIWRMILYDHNPANHELYKTIITETTTTIDNGSPTSVMNIKQYSSSGTLIYDATGDEELATHPITVGIYDNEGNAYEDFRTISIDKTGDHSITVLTFNYSGDDSPVISDISFDETIAAINDSLFYQLTGYVITITVDSGTIALTTTPYSGSNPDYSGIRVSDSNNVITVTGLLIKYIAPAQP